MSDDLLSDLNEQQRAAVTHGDGPLLVLAGVGTGKTTVITRRIAWLIAEKRARPAEILALTFTERAAAEMEERVDLLVPYGYIEAKIGTFHSFCDSILRENAILLGLSPDYQILTEAEQVIFLKDHLFELPLKRFRPLGNPVKHLSAILKLFSRAKDEDVTAEEYLAYAEKLATEGGDGLDEEEAMLRREEIADQTELAETYVAYQRLMAENGFVDFGDLITLTLKLLREHPLVRKRYQDRFRYILVDEFQDTNYAQFELLKLLAGHRNLTVCGDDDQSIYKFRGAAISNILGFRSEYQDSELIVLVENYRSTQQILDSAYRLIQFNNPDRLEVREGIEKRLHAAAGDGTAVQQQHFQEIDDECDFVADTIVRGVKGGRSYRDYAILVRSNAQADSFLQALNLVHIPWHFSGSRGLYDREEIRTIIAFLRILSDPRDNMSFHYVASSFFYDVPPQDLAFATSYARRRNKSLFEVFRVAGKSEEFLGLSQEGREAMTKLADDLAALLPIAAREKTGEVLYNYLTERTGTIARLSNSAEAQDALKVQNIAKFFSIIERFSRVAKYDRVPWFIDYLDSLIDAGDNPPVGEADWDEDAVNVLTIHQAKGLEFPVVFLVGLVSGRFPSANRRDAIPLPDGLIKDILPGAESDFHKQEERRLFYVGMTRAKEELYLTSAKDYGGKRPRKPSQFVSEALDLPPAALNVVKSSPVASLLRRGKQPVEEVMSDDLVLIPRGEEMLVLSNKKIDDYLTCPMKYRYIHILKVPIRQHHSVIYGSAIHQAIKRYNTARHIGEAISLSDVQDAFRKAWQTEGFLTREHEELRYQEGLQALSEFYTHAQAEEATPTYIEQHFSFVDSGVKIVGVFDRIDIPNINRPQDGLIIDYKTSQVKSQEEAEKKTKASRQLAIYALAYEHLFNALPAALELRFLTPKLFIGRVAPTEKALDKARSEIERAAKGIRAGRFPAEPSYFACSYCPYRAICPAKQ
ncbi:ATP-dependent helicase [Candidatus Bipolaricaulota bacterium]|nr:ATP-dependent helicase [Candidatus Bipolaricaulota bacterium]